MESLIARKCQRIIDDSRFDMPYAIRTPSTMAHGNRAAEDHDDGKIVVDDRGTMLCFSISLCSPD